MRFLLDPAATDGGAAPASPAPAAATAAPTNPDPAPTPAPTPEPARVSLPADEVARLYDAARRFSDLEAEKLRAVEAKEQEKLLALAQKGEVDKAFDKFKGDASAKFAALEQKFLDRERSLTIADSLTNRTFVSEDAGRQVRDILGARVESVLGPDGSVIVRDRATGRPAGDVIRELLDSPAFAHFLPAKSQGGTGSAGGSKPAPAATDRPMTVTEALLAKAREEMAGKPAPGAPIGLAHRGA